MQLLMERKIKINYIESSFNNVIIEWIAMEQKYINNSIQKILSWVYFHTSKVPFIKNIQTQNTFNTFMECK